MSITVMIMSLILITLLVWPILICSSLLSRLLSLIEWFSNGVVFGTLPTLSSTFSHTQYTVLTLTLLSLCEPKLMSSNSLSVTGSDSSCSLRPMTVPISL